jgi:hypothetical protein
MSTLGRRAHRLRACRRRHRLVVMQRRRRLRRVLRWGGTVACCLILAAIGASVARPVAWTWARRSANPAWLSVSECYLSDGAITANTGSLANTSTRKLSPGIHVFALRRTTGWVWWCRPYRRVVGTTGRLHIVDVPLWVPFLLVLVPTAGLWYQDWRTIPPGHCQKCGYNLMGNESGRCPECGTALFEMPPPRRHPGERVMSFVRFTRRWPEG